MIEIYNILFEFAKNFASPPPPPKEKCTFGWWGHDTDLGDCKDCFKETENKIKEYIEKNYVTIKFHEHHLKENKKYYENKIRGMKKCHYQE
jgi:hypothetical protein